MKFLVLTFLFFTLSLALANPPMFRLLAKPEKDVPPTPLYLASKDGEGTLSAEYPPIEAFLDPEPMGMLKSKNGTPAYLLPTGVAGMYNLRFGGIPKIAGVLYYNFSFIESTSSFLGYGVGSQGRYEGTFRASQNGSDRTVQFSKNDLVMVPPESTKISLIKEPVGA